MAAAAVERPVAPPPPQQRYQGVQKESAGYRLLSAMGWREGEGLGAAKQGIKAHIRVKKKFENWGVGAVEAAEHAQNWTNGMLDFHRVLSNLSEVVSEHARRAANGSSSGSDDSDASGGEQAARPRAKRAERQPAAAAGGKKRRAAAPSSGSSGSSSEEEAAAPPPRRIKAATHIGRFKKREAAKMVKGYSEHDLAAILGADPFPAAAAAVPEVRAQRQPSSSDDDSEAQPSGGNGVGAASRQQQQPQQAEVAPPPKPEMIVLRRPMLAGSLRPPQPSTPQESRQPGWWQLCFHRAAGPGAGAGAGVGAGTAAAQPAAINIHGFSEQDQTNLYNLAHDKATQGRVGLGRSGMPKKVAGARWEGKRTRISDSEEEGEEEGQPQQQEVAAAPAGVELAQEEGLVIILPASKRHLLHQLGGQQAAAAQQQQQQQQQQPAAGNKAKKAKKARAAAEPAQPAAAGAADSGLGRIKWRRAVAGALKAAGKGKLKLSKLHRAVVKEQAVGKAQRAAALQALTAFLQQSSKFELKDGSVRAVA